jgi:hypothetical protein
MHIYVMIDLFSLDPELPLLYLSIYAIPPQDDETRNIGTLMATSAV